MRVLGALRVIVGWLLCLCWWRTLLFLDIVLASGRSMVVVPALNPVHRRKITSGRQSPPLSGFNNQKCVGNSRHGNANVQR